ncbi:MULTISPECIES: hypothetical protein [unclassified Saccharicrinis]|uniref:hypothetical protein n=1 Tax=unclassified Saccharicrinis TaxID=2646859 RepID=UPI003D32A9E8
MNLSGKWSFKEEFDFGKDEGEVVLTQAGNRVYGILGFTEFIEDEIPFKVKCHLDGRLEGNKIKFEVVGVELSSTETLEYFPEKREGIINANGQIVGSSEDEQGVCGVFVMERV